MSGIVVFLIILAVILLLIFCAPIRALAVVLLKVVFGIVRFIFGFFQYLYYLIVCLSAVGPIGIGCILLFLWLIWYVCSLI